MDSIHEERRLQCGLSVVDLVGIADVGYGCVNLGPENSFNIFVFPPTEIILEYEK